MEKVRIPIMGKDLYSGKDTRICDVVETEDDTIIEIKQRHKITAIRLNEFYKQINNGINK